MPDWRSIVVPLDGSLVAEGALPLAADIARRSGALLHLVHVRAPAPAVALAGAGDSPYELGESAYLAREADRVCHAGPCMTAELAEPDPVAALTAYAVSAQCDLVVLATHGRGALGRAWIGSMADRLVTRLPMPLLIVRPADRPTPTPARERIRNLAVLLDGSERAEAILDAVTRLGRLYDARYALIRVSTEPSGPGVGDARLYLEEVAQVLRGRGLETTTLVLPGWDAAAAVADFAWGAGADLIALATHGHTGAAQRASVTQELLRLGPAPLLTLLAPGE